MQFGKLLDRGRVAQVGIVVFWLISVSAARSQFVAFNDHAPGVIGVTTSSNATTWDIFAGPPGATGRLRDIKTGANLAVTLTITTNGFVQAANAGANPLPGTPLYNVFNTYVDFQGAGNADAVAHVYSNAVVTYTLTGLNTNRLYSFMGSAVRGGVGGTYPQRWTTFELDGALAFRSAHTAGCYTNGLATNQVAINTGVNTNGDMADWEAIVPGSNGSISIVSTQYMGPIPIGGTANGPYCYALNGMRLVEFNPPLIATASAVGNNGVQVVFSIPVSPATATNLANYTLTNATGNVPILGAAFVNDSQTIQLTTAAMTPNAAHWLGVYNVVDAATGLSVIATNSQVVFTNIPFTVGYVKREIYTNITGANVASLTNSAKFPNSPDQVDYPPNTGWPVVNIGDYYGGRFSGWLVPPMTGQYYFAIRSDDSSQLTLSPNNSPAYRVVLAAEPSCCEAFDAHTNGPMTLIAGQRYYIEALMKEQTGGDYLYVAWKTPTNLSWTVIPGQNVGNYLMPAGATLTISRQPTNTTAMVDYTATFSVSATGNSSITTNLTYQWQLNGLDLPGASASSYTTPMLHAADNGSVFRVLVSVPGKAQFSSNAVLTVIPDTIPPTALRALGLGPTNVQIVFSKPVEAASATNRLNYFCSGGITISAAALDSTFTNVFLTTTPLTYGSNYSVTINNVRDQATPPNTIAANTIVTFTALPYAPQDIGGSAIPSTITLVSNGVNVVAAGTDIAGFSDQFNFDYQIRTGDFDIAARISGLSLSDLWAKAGLMARETLDPGARFAASLATPGLNGCYFASRDPAYSTVVTLGSFPANYPYTWLRLRRVGNVFTGYAGYDGQNWSLLGSDTVALPAQIYFGLAISSHKAAVTTTAQFQDIADVTTNNTVTIVVNPSEPLGPSSRKSPIAISEIMYKPAPRADGRNLEYLELYNSNPWFHDLSGYQLTADNLSYTFPSGTVMPGGSFLVIAAAPADIQTIYGITNVMGPYTGSLKKSGTIELLDELGAVLLTIPYDNVRPWPVAPDGTGHSLVLARPSYGEGDPRAWDISDSIGGSPGAMDGYRPDPLRNVVINEFLAHTDPPYTDYIELYNHANQPVDISGCILTDNADTNKFIIPSGTILPARGFISFDQPTLGFHLSAAGGEIFFKNSSQTRVLDSLNYEDQEHNTSMGRWPDGANDFYRLTVPTPGAANTNILIDDVVINELMYDPISGNDDDQYVELYNQGSVAHDLSGWTLNGGVSFTFPTNTSISANGYLVIGRNIARLMTNYPNLNVNNTLGNYSGKLSHNGERLMLTKPDMIAPTNSGPMLIHIVVDEVTWSTGGRWGQWAAGGGSSLELINPRSNHRLAPNWADSDETHKSSWVNIENTGVLDNGKNYDPSIDYAQIGILDVGECLVDNIEVHPGTQTTNYVRNPDFESGLTNWTLQGDHIRSSLENEGYNSAHSLHLRTGDHIWTGDNSCEAALVTNTLAAGQTATLRFKARWLHGWPEVLLRLNGNWLEATGPLAVPANLGTPGARNSRYVANPGPALYQVSHSPPVPASNQNVVVTARVHDAGGLQSLTLYYRVDPSKTYSGVVMKDDGTGGDAIAGDGIFSGTIPAPNTNAIVAFYLSAVDTAAAATRFPAIPNNNSLTPPECVVMFSDSNPGGSFTVYHLWITQTNADLWSAQSDLSNESWDCTIVNNSRIIYNAQARFAGSPYHQGFNTPYGNLCHYKWIFPDDDAFLGATSFNKIHDPGNGAGDDASLQREECANTFLRALGVPWLNRHLVAVYVNGNRRGVLMEDAQTPDGDVVKEHFPNDKDGFLYKMQPWFEFGPAPNGSSTPFANQSWCNLMPYTTTGGIKKVARYRYNFEIRRTPTSANDFTNVFSLIDAANSYGSANYVANMQNMANMENWMRVFAANHAAGNWDSFGAQNSQNLYGYIGTQGTKYSLMMFDFNIVLGNAGSWGPGQNLFTVNGQDPNMANIYNTPAFRRMYWRALQELVNGPLNPLISGPLLDAKYQTITASGLTAEDPNTNIKPWLSSAQSSIASQLSAANTGTFSVSSAGVVNNTVVITGTAPVVVQTITFNGVPWPLTWLSVTSWRAVVPLQPGGNSFTIIGLDRHGQPVPGASTTVGTSFTGTLPSPVGQVVINEIMYQPALPDAQFVELYNNSSTNTFDLSGWEFRGLGYTFPAGSSIGPNSYLVLAANNAAFAAAYGATKLVYDISPGTLQTDGETLSLVQPGTNAATDVYIDRVRYSSALPWSTTTNLGSSLQLIDPTQDNWRAGNWAISAAPGSSPGAINTVFTSLPAFQPLWINELQADNLTGITNSVGQRVPWIEVFNPTTNQVSLNGVYLANSYTNLLSWAFPTNAVINPGEFKVIFADGLTNLTTLTELHAGFTLTSANGSVALSRVYNGQPQVLDYIDYVNLGQNHSYGSVPDGQSFARQEFFYVTPGASNNAASAPLSVAINEWMAGNTTTIVDPVNGKYDDWFELYNYGTNTVHLDGYYLTDSLTNQFKFAIPTGYSIPPQGFLLVWADGKNTNGTPELHVNFKLSKNGESIGLYGADGRAIDYVSYGLQIDNVSEGRYPDGGASVNFMVNPTPGTNNIFNTAPILAPIANQQLILGQTLSLYASATDTDQPPQTLTYTLAPGAPPGAAVNPFNGLLTWTPTTAPSTNSFTVVATDNGVPSLSATQSFITIVFPPPQMQSLTQFGTNLTFTWFGVPGQTYQLEYKDNLDDPAWAPDGGPIAGTGSLIVITNSPSESTQRFFRLRIP